ncbi:hypothetical protein OPV22_000626 [Ensete ventricosum]|uniref:Acid phosphatase n=1 Tax=Ensete ventricosum TaxID=4639 RepID=A0AAV8RNF0_ENSVE|nr:hypothetical protein OPV22_000626 [Ensete ventricosum]
MRRRPLPPPLTRPNPISPAPLPPPSAPFLLALLCRGGQLLPANFSSNPSPPAAAYLRRPRHSLAGALALRLPRGENAPTSSSCSMFKGYGFWFGLLRKCSNRLSNRTGRYQWTKRLEHSGTEFDQLSLVALYLAFGSSLLVESDPQLYFFAPPLHGQNLLLLLSKAPLFQSSSKGCPCGSWSWRSTIGTRCCAAGLSLSSFITVTLKNGRYGLFAEVRIRKHLPYFRWRVVMLSKGEDNIEECLSMALLARSNKPRKHLDGDKDADAQSICKCISIHDDLFHPKKEDGKKTNMVFPSGPRLALPALSSGLRIHPPATGEDHRNSPHQVFVPPATGPCLSSRRRSHEGFMDHRRQACSFAGGVREGDLGQTEWTASTLARVAESNYDMLLLPGDLSYADTQQPLWDSFGRFVQPYASSRPWMVTEGNHDIEAFPVFHCHPFVAYDNRWRMPYEESGSASNLYYSFDVAGAVHVVMLGSYADFNASSAQYKWLVADLAKVDRRITPWLVALLHAPWYNTNLAHQGEGESMRQAMESLLYQARADVVFAGHVHAYERFTRAYDNKANPCGPAYITIGDGGNREGLALQFDKHHKSASLSLFREASFGHGRLKVVNATHAHWSWHRNDEDDGSTVGDELWVESLSASAACGGLLGGVPSASTKVEL